MRWPKDDEMMTKANETQDDWTVMDVTAAFNVLKAKSNVGPIGIVGHCWGGPVAWLGACHIGELVACAIFYGGRVKLSMGEGNPPAIELAKHINCPVAGFFGNEDKNPTPDDVDDDERALTEAGIPDEFHRYDGAGHAFQNFPTPDRYREAQSEDAWEKLLVFLARTLHLPSL